MASTKSHPPLTNFQKIKKELEADPEAFEQYFRVLKLAGIGNMVGGVTHTLNNVLGGILGYAQLLKEEVDESSDAYRHALVIEKAAKRASKVVSQLQVVSEKGRHAKKSLDPKQIVEQVISILESTFNRNIKIKAEFNHSTAKILANPSSLCQVLLNICLSSRSALPSSGEILVQTALQDDKFVVFKISDKGKGTKKQFMPYLFEPFSIAGRSDPNSGLMLAVAQELVDQHEGKIEVKSTAGKGTTFSVLMPVEKGSLKVSAEAKVNGRLNGKSATILVVDDEKELREMAKLIFEKKGFKVLLAGDGPDAVKVFKKNSNKINLVILDMILPGEDGAEVYKKIRRIKPKSKIILTSGYVNNSPFKDIIEKGSATFIPKPWDIPGLINEAYSVLQENEL